MNDGETLKMLCEIMIVIRNTIEAGIMEVNEDNSDETWRYVNTLTMQAVNRMGPLCRRVGVFEDRVYLYADETLPSIRLTGAALYEAYFNNEQGTDVLTAL
jgi:hypothetical protein